MLQIQLESERIEDFLSTDDHYMEENFTDPVWCYTDDMTTDTENVPETDDGEQYFSWQVLVGLHQSITISFMLVGHVKFSPDWSFGLLKQCKKFRFISSLQEVVDVVNKSADVNTAQLVSTHRIER